MPSPEGLESLNASSKKNQDSCALQLLSVPIALFDLNLLQFVWQ